MGRNQASGFSELLGKNSLWLRPGSAAQLIQAGSLCSALLWEDKSKSQSLFPPQTGRSGESSLCSAPGRARNLRNPRGRGTLQTYPD